MQRISDVLTCATLGGVLVNACAALGLFGIPTETAEAAGTLIGAAIGLVVALVNSRKRS